MGNTPKVGDSAPDFELADSTGKKRSLKDLTNGSNVLLIFFRGLW